MDISFKYLWQSLSVMQISFWTMRYRFQREMWRNKADFLSNLFSEKYIRITFSFFFSNHSIKDIIFFAEWKVGRKWDYMTDNITDKLTKLEMLSSCGIISWQNRRSHRTFLPCIPMINFLFLPTKLFCNIMMTMKSILGQHIK